MKQQAIEHFTRHYGRPPTVVARAPGRIEFIGNHTDYNGGTVLGAAIDRGVWIAAGPAPAGRLRFASDAQPEPVTVPAAAPRPLAGAQRWANYPLGVWAVFREFGLRPPDGLDCLVVSNLPVGAGLSSSAALELASALAYLGLTGESPPRATVVQLGRRAENEFVGVPCGLLDQSVSGFGRRNHLVFIDCRGPRFETVPLPPGAHFWVFNTQAKHALIDGLYAARHRECQEAARALGVPLLADATPALLAAAEPRLPGPLARRARHVVEEIERVAQVRAALARGDLAAVGRLLTASHASSRTQFENSTAELDQLVDTLTRTPHVYGARLTGGGFGGAVMALTDAAFAAADAAGVTAAYVARFGTAPDVLHCQTDQGAELLAL
ncbi:MAG TPA: galactokinase [Opitutaceae bacterium]|nr:galactokinase [Opitutaceae bacterium]